MTYLHFRSLLSAALFFSSASFTFAATPSPTPSSSPFTYAATPLPSSTPTRTFAPATTAPLKLMNLARPSDAKLIDIYPASRSFGRCSLSEVIADCGYLMKDNFGWDPRGYVLGSSSTIEAFVGPDGSYDNSQLISQCRSMIEQHLDWSGCSTDFSPSPSCQLSAEELATTKTRYQSDTPWWHISFRGRKEKIYISQMSKQPEKLILEWTETTLNANEFDKVLNPCDESISQPVFEMGSYSTLVDGGLNSNFTGGVVNVEQTLERYFVTPLSVEHAESFNLLQACFKEGADNAPWEPGIPRDVTDVVNFYNQAPRSQNCGFLGYVSSSQPLSVLPPGSKLYDIAKQSEVGGKRAIIEGKIDEQFSNLSPAGRPRELRTSNPFVEIALGSAR